MNAWTRQQLDGIDKARHALTRRQSICLVAPTGFGKTRIASQIALSAQAKSAPWVFLTHRRFLFGQTVKAFQDAGLDFGCVAAEWESWQDPTALGQICMLPTLYAREGSLPPARLAFVDEIHANKSGRAADVIQHYRDSGARIVGLTATPVGLAKVVQELVVVANNSQARDVGAILPAKVYAPDEVDLHDVRPLAVGKEFSQVELAKRFKLHQVVGSVYDHWQQLNPQQLPAIGFAPGVSESMWFCDEFIRRGVRCAHIDGEKVYMGERDKDGQPVVHEGKDKRDEVVEGSRNGTYKVVWNRFVLREGVDWPWLYHGIFATAFSTVESWLQSVGRVLRNFDGYDHVLIQDHGGNSVRPGLGDPNADREWCLSDTSATLLKKATREMQHGEVEQAKVCPQCRSFMVAIEWRRAGGKCPTCGYKFKLSVRHVIQTDGALREVRGNAVKVKAAPTNNAQKAWDNVFWPSRKSKRPKSSTFRQLVGRFHKEFPQFRIVETRDAICVRHQDGRLTELKRVPPPGSGAWDRRVKHVAIQDLQG